MSGSIILQYSGVLYTCFIVGVTAINILYICPTVYDSDCRVIRAIAFLVFSEIMLNLVMFHIYMKRNQVQFWTTKSSSFLGIGKESECPQYAEKEIIEAIDSIFTDCETEKVMNHNFPHCLKTYEKLEISNDGTYKITSLNDHKEAKLNAYRKYCKECRRNVPRRCHHCPLCKICILRKDHHCILLSGCVGLANLRYFIVFLFWTTVGSILVSISNFLYLNKFLVYWFPFGWTVYIGPVSLIRWFFGYESLLNAIIAVVFSLSFGSIFGTGAFLIFQVIYLSSGYTMHDFHSSKSNFIDCDGNNINERLALIFGQRWWLNFIFPQFWVQNEMTPSIAKNVFLSISKDL